jgi:peptide/nickel transport system substrate-binding protein
MSVRKYSVLWLWFMAVAGCLAIVVCPAWNVWAQPPAPEGSDKAKFGGMITVAWNLAPAHLDPNKSTASEYGDIGYNIFEGLFEPDAAQIATPHLAESYKIENGGKTYFIKLRQGVKFHNGKEMTVEDVIASFNRWLANNGGGKMVAPYFESIGQGAGPYDVVIHLKQLYAPFLNILSSNVANQKMFVMPKSVIDAAGDKPMDNPVGTGPYKLAGFIPDQHAKLVRFAEYTPVNKPSSFMAGERKAYSDEIVYKFLPEEAVRIAGVQSGEFDFAVQVSSDQYKVLAGDPKAEPLIVPETMEHFFIFNDAQPPFNNAKARQALNYCLSIDAIAMATSGDSKFWVVDPSYMIKKSAWYTPDVGKGVYNTVDIEKAKQLLKESGYSGAPIVILCSSADTVSVQAAQVAKAQAEVAGFKVDVQVYDRPTAVGIRSKKEGWHIFPSGFIASNPDPQVFGAWMGTNRWITNWDDDDSRKMDTLFDRMMVEIDPAKRLEIVKEWNQEIYRTLPYIKLHNYSILHARSKKLLGVEAQPRIMFWNAWKEKAPAI